MCTVLCPGIDIDQGQITMSFLLMDDVTSMSLVGSHSLTRF